MKVELKYGHVVDVNVGAMSEEWLAWAVAFAIRQSAGDADAGKANTPEGRKAVLDKAERLAKGEIPSGGVGGARLTPEVRAEREVVEGALRKMGAKAKDARDAAKDGLAALEPAIEAYLAKMGITDPEQVLAVIDKNMTKFRDEATRLAKQYRDESGLAIEV